MRKKTAKNLSEIKGRSKIPNDLYRWMMKTESKYGDKVTKLDVEVCENTLRAIYYTNDNGYWKTLDMCEVAYTESQANDFFDGKLESKVDFLIKLADDQIKIKGMLDSLYNENTTAVDPETDKALRLAFSNIERRIKANQSSKLEVNGNHYMQDFRKYDFFTARKGEEDDDWPEFTGHKEAKDIAENELKSAGIKYKRLVISESEKSWFSVEVYV